MTLHSQPKTLGYWLSDKKTKKLSLPDILASLRSRNIEPIKIDLEKSLDNQGPFDGVLHKLTDFIAQAEQGNLEADRLVNNVHDYCTRHPEIIAIDPLDKLRTLMNRFKTYSVVDKAMKQMNADVAFVPKIVALHSNDSACNVRKIREAGVTYPIVCKPFLSHGSSSAHQMTLVFNDQGLGEAVFPCVAQSFVNHNATMHKLFVLGKNYFLVERPSIKDFSDSKDYAPIHFDGTKISKQNFVSKLTVQGEQNFDDRKHRQLCPEILSMIVDEIGKAMGLSLFGIDLVVDDVSGRYAIVDVNAFPGYDGVENFSDKLADFVREKLDNHTTAVSDPLTNSVLIKNGKFLH